MLPTIRKTGSYSVSQEQPQQSYEQSELASKTGALSLAMKALEQAGQDTSVLAPAFQQLAKDAQKAADQKRTTKAAADFKQGQPSQSNSVRDFFEFGGFVERGIEEDFVSTVLLYEAYRRYCAGLSTKPADMPVNIKAFGSKVALTMAGKKSQRRYVQGIQQRGFSGLRLS